jgi:molybdopterin-guanine dinucleotide biosynthesis protein
MDVVFVDGLAGSPLPRIVLSREDDPLPDALLTSGDVIAVVQPPVRSAAILDRIALDVSSRTSASRQHASPA